MMLASRRASASLPTTETNASIREAFSGVAGAADAPVYLVGGAVRDLIDGVVPVDLDFACAGDPGALAERAADRFGGNAFPLDSERGHHRVTRAESPRDLDFGPLGADIDSNLRERDFTFNAMALPLHEDGSVFLDDLIDPTDGRADLKARIVRMTSEAALVADPLRLLRAVRFQIERGMVIEERTSEAIREHSARLASTAGERQREELVRIFATDSAADGVRLLDALGLLDVILPELAPSRGVDQPANHHYYDVFDHSVETVAALDALLARATPAGKREREFRDVLLGGLDPAFDLRSYLNEPIGAATRGVLLKLAGLLHDVSKPETKSTDATGRIRFLGHPEQGATKSELICRRLRFGNRETQFVSLLVEEHLRPVQIAAPGQMPSDRAVYRFFRDLDDAAPACLVLALADGIAAVGPRRTPAEWKPRVGYLNWLLVQSQAQEQALAAPRLVTGRDLIEALDITQGPVVGRLLAIVEEAIATGAVRTREEAIGLAREALERGDTP